MVARRQQVEAAVTNPRSQPVLSGETTIFVLATAAQRAWNDGRNSVGTDYLLEEVARRIDPLSSQFGTFRSALRDRLAACDVDDPEDGDASGSSSEANPEVEASLREAAGIARRRLGSPWAAAAPAWTGGVRRLLESALIAAEQHGEHRVHWARLASCLLGEPTGRSAVAMESLGANSNQLRETMWIHQSPNLPDQPTGAALGVLTLAGGLDTGTRLLRIPQFFARRQFTRRGGGPIALIALEYEAIRQAVRMGHQQVHAAHLLVAIAAMGQDLHDSGHTLRKSFAAHGRADTLLTGAGVAYPSLAHWLVPIEFPDAATDRNRFWRRFPHNPPVGVDVAATIGQASTLAAERTHRPAGSEHLLLAILNDLSPSIARVLTKRKIDTKALRLAVLDRIGPPRR